MLNNPRTPAMKFSICSTGLKGMILEKVLEAAAQLQLHGVELWDGHLEAYLDSGGSPAELRRQFTEHQLVVPAISTYATFSKSKEDWEQDLQHIQRAARWAAELDCPRVRTFAGHLPSREANSALWEQVQSGLCAASEVCAQFGIRLAVEMHNNTLADTEESLAALLELGGPSVELIFDGFNFFVDQLDPLPALLKFYPRITHVHVKNYKWNHHDWAQSVPVPVLQGDSDQRTILQKLVELEYGGFVSFEYFGDQVLELTRLSYLEVANQFSGGGAKRP
ncbi:sugar phosphate isomerase/epimerase family protein [Paenibacillus phoenicis]|uniref:Sugar phosphate isomerase/epimerase family protein n=1 Tax=Paenibacillus phoenicis TaxID=554117 RepID=A0ABU5PGV2_9BACL|nr:sugar phosphate isomerase/epimerase family protein [Paenibacillus phoenicis]MEA3569121.1 sugar phosphate isomerase/epimerase family protein [Paenibacillus phoenicis]